MSHWKRSATICAVILLHASAGMAEENSIGQAADGEAAQHAYVKKLRMTCSMFGFTLGTDRFSDCVQKLHEENLADSRARAEQELAERRTRAEQAAYARQVQLERRRAAESNRGKTSCISHVSGSTVYTDCNPSNDEARSLMEMFSKTPGDAAREVREERREAREAR